MFKTLNSRTGVVKVALVAGSVLLLASVLVWWRQIYSSPTAVFDRMLANSLSTTAVTKTVYQNDQSQKLQQTNVISNLPKQTVHSINVLGQASSDATNVTTESIGTPTADFVRYLMINTNQKNKDNQSFDFSGVIGLWGKTTPSDASGSGVQLYNQSIFGVIPFADIPQPKREHLVEAIKNSGAYKYNPNNVKRSKTNGRPAYEFDVEVSPVEYVNMLKEFASDLEIRQLDQVRAEDYQNSPPLKFKLSVDVWSGLLIKISYANSERTEVYSSYGAKTNVTLPSSTVPSDTLQARLQEIH